MAKTARPGRVALTPAQKKERADALKNETKAAKFVRLGVPRMTKTLNAVRQVGNLAGPGYEYTPDQVEKMKVALLEAIEETFLRFNRAGAKEKPTFSL